VVRFDITKWKKGTQLHS